MGPLLAQLLTPLPDRVQAASTLPGVLLVALAAGPGFTLICSLAIIWLYKRRVTLAMKSEPQSEHANKTSFFAEIAPLKAYLRDREQTSPRLLLDAQSRVR